MIQNHFAMVENLGDVSAKVCNRLGLAAFDVSRIVQPTLAHCRMIISTALQTGFALCVLLCLEELNL